MKTCFLIFCKVPNFNSLGEIRLCVLDAQSDAQSDADEIFHVHDNVLLSVCQVTIFS